MNVTCVFMSSALVVTSKVTREPTQGITAMSVINVGRPSALGSPSLDTIAFILGRNCMYTKIVEKPSERAPIWHST
jgi:hypothetical protein